MSASASSRPLRKVARTHREVVDAAAELLAEAGHDAVTLNDVATRAGVAVQTIYNRVGSRASLLAAVAERAFATNRRYMDPAYSAPLTGLERIRLACDAYTRFALENPHEFRLLVEPPSDPEISRSIATLVSGQNAKLTAALEEAVRSGDLVDELPPGEASTVLWASLNGILLLATRRDELQADPSRVRRLVALFEQMCLRALRP